jgi:hypothetical protein
MESIFTNIYEDKLWGDNENNNYSGSSGEGSDIEYNKKYIELLKKIINEYNIRNIVDLGCGDFRIGKLLYDDLNITYTGYDTYKKVIDYNITEYHSQKYTFEHIDFFTNKESIVTGDMCILKDVIQHWSLNEIYIFLDYLVESKKFKYILLINCCNQKKDNEDCDIGDWRQLSCNFLPLKKYNAIKMYNYNSKEISIILPSLC